MALTVKPGKTPLVFEYDDGVVSSSIKILPEDDQATIVAKLKRVIALVEGEQPQGFVYTKNEVNPRPPILLKAAEPPQLGPEQRANGWDTLGADDLKDAPGESG